MGHLSVGHDRPHQDAVHVQPTAHRCEDVLKTHNFFRLINSSSPKLSQMCIFSSCLPDFSVGAQVLDGHLARLGGAQPNLGVRRRLRLLPQDVLIGQVAPVHRVPQDQLARVGAAGKQPV